MFVGAINGTVRKYLASIAPAFDDAKVVVGCSGNFTSEAVICHHARPTSVHSNDVSLYSCMLGRWLLGLPLEFEIAEPEYNWLSHFMDTDVQRMATIMALLPMLEFDKRNNAHKRRMWQHHAAMFPGTVDKNIEHLEHAISIPISSFYAGDVFDHFREQDEPGAIFCCYAPTYTGGYERLYRRLEQVLSWQAPSYPMLDDARRDELVAWMAERRFLWYDDREIPGLPVVMKQQSGRNKTVYLYSNVADKSAVFVDYRRGPLPDLSLAGMDFDICQSSQVSLAPIKTTALARFKDAFLSKNIEHGEGMWAFAVMVDGLVAGFLEFDRDRYGGDGLYMMADFAVPHTKYQRLSKLMVMLAISGETRRAVERLSVRRQANVKTTAFTDRPVSMKYRGPMKLKARGTTDDGENFLQYQADFNDASWQDTLGLWLKRNGSAQSCRN